MNKNEIALEVLGTFIGLKEGSFQKGDAGANDVGISEDSQKVEGESLRHVIGLVQIKVVLDENKVR